MTREGVGMAPPTSSPASLDFARDKLLRAGTAARFGFCFFGGGLFQETIEREGGRSEANLSI